MNFDLNDEQRLLSDSIGRLLSDHYDVVKRRRYSASEDGFSREVWAAFAELGLTALPFSEADGGIGGGAEEIMIVMNAIGEALALEPYLSHVVMSASLLRHVARDEMRAELTSRIASGAAFIVPAVTEPLAPYRLSLVETRARREGAHFILDGHKTLVPHGGLADILLVSARLDGGVEDSTGIGIFAVKSESEGLTRRAYPTQDGGRAAEIALSGVKLSPDDLLIDAATGFHALSAMADEALAAVCAEAVGIMERMLHNTVDYLKTRKQFGQTIGNFQALQHRAADMAVELEQARSMALYATMMCRKKDESERARALSAAKVQINRSARLIGQECVQLHGGIGMTMEHSIGHAMKRLAMIEKMFGDRDFHMDRLAERMAAS